MATTAKAPVASTLMYIARSFPNDMYSPMQVHIICKRLSCFVCMQRHLFIRARSWPPSRPLYAVCFSETILMHELLGTDTGKI